MHAPDSSPHHSTTWTLERVKTLVELWLVRTAGQIARELGGVTRNAVISKANRMHLQAKPQNPKAVKTPRREARFEPRPPRYVAPPAPPPPPEAPASLALTIYELAFNQCHYAEGDGPPFLFCGHEIQPGSPYCPYHHRVCYLPLSPARRELARPLSQWRGMGHG